MPTIIIENLKNGIQSEIDQAVWNEKKAEFGRDFRVVSKPATPPEVKELEAKQAAAISEEKTTTEVDEEEENESGDLAD